MFNGRNKGSKAEREIAKMMETWWSPLEPGCKFVRTPLSGGWGGPSTRAGFKASGDLMTTAKRFHFSVEVKRREGWTWDRLRAGKTSPVWEWWQQAIGQAVEMTAEPLLFLRHNREEWHIMMRDKLACFLALPATLESACDWTEEQMFPHAIRLDAHPVVYLADDIVKMPPSHFADLAPA